MVPTEKRSIHSACLGFLWQVPGAQTAFSLLPPASGRLMAYAEKTLSSLCSVTQEPAGFESDYKIIPICPLLCSLFKGHRRAVFAKLIGRLCSYRQARLVWKTECFLPAALGNHPQSHDFLQWLGDFHSILLAWSPCLNARNELGYNCDSQTRKTPFLLSHRTCFIHMSRRGPLGRKGWSYDICVTNEI